MPIRKSKPKIGRLSAKPIWAKAAAGGPSPRLLRFCAGRDVVGRPPADASLIPYDLWTNRAHCAMLARRGIIPARTGQTILRALDQLEREWRAGEFILDPALEDVHINIERFVAARAGEQVAGVMHTARSRNDQAATDVRLWLRDRLLERMDAVLGLVRTLAALAARHASTLAPGWTHGQPAMPTSLGHWAAAHAWALARDAESLAALWPLVNQSPLGAAAGFGTSWPIDRRMTARLLAFDAPSPNSLDAISTRWEAEARVGAALAVQMTHLSSLAQDLIFLSTPPRGAIRLADAHVTGSSIMPNKRNPDFAEVTRARAQSVHGLLANLLGVGRGALSGYNRDTQWTKYWIMDLVDEVGEAPEVMSEVIAAIAVDKRRLATLASEGLSIAADLADHLAHTRSLPFRRAYHLIGEAVAGAGLDNQLRLEAMNEILRRENIRPIFNPEEWTTATDPREALKRRVSQGAPAPADVRAQARALRAAAARMGRWRETRLRRIQLARR